MNFNPFQRTKTVVPHDTFAELPFRDGAELPQINEALRGILQRLDVLLAGKQQPPPDIGTMDAKLKHLAAVMRESHEHQRGWRDEIATELRATLKTILLIAETVRETVQDSAQSGNKTESSWDTLMTTLADLSDQISGLKVAPTEMKATAGTADQTEIIAGIVSSIKEYSGNDFRQKEERGVTYWVVNKRPVFIVSSAAERDLATSIGRTQPLIVELGQLPPPPPGSAFIAVLPHGLIPLLKSMEKQGARATVERQATMFGG